MIRGDNTHKLDEMNEKYRKIGEI